MGGTQPHLHLPLSSEVGAQPQLHHPPNSRAECSVAFSPVGELEVAGTADDGYLIHVEKTKGGKSMGLELGIVKNVGFGDWTSGGLKVKKVRGGLVREWNWWHTTKVRTGDIIVEVNSVRGSGEALLKKMENETVLELRLLPHGCDDRCSKLLPHDDDDDDRCSNLSDRSDPVFGH